MFGAQSSSLVAVLMLILAPALPARGDEPLAESQQPRTVEDAVPGPEGPFPARPPTGEARALSAALSLGPGWLALHDDIGRDSQGAFSLAARVGAVVAPQLNLFLEFDRTATQRGDATFSQIAGLIGLEVFLLDRVYLGGGLGLAWVAETGVPGGLTDGPAGTLSAHLGVEVVRTAHAAITAELGVTGAQYDREAWEMGGVRIGVIAF